mmetsp:Transcript_111235/g.321621  ORF Transcript_111235/g.321621 Transcript_111235/m.321621 type:complete len:377 (+) Transcript_111235:124-1254(+)
MARRFTPVSDPERARCEQDEESLRKHRKFDTPFAMLPSDLNAARSSGREDMRPLGRKDGELEQDEHGLWRKKQELFEKKQTWGRETMEYSNPEQARVDGNEGPKYGRPGVAGWVKQGKFGGRGEDRGLAVLQRGEVQQAMEKNEKGLWVRKKAPVASDDMPAASSGHWRCAKCGLESSASMEFCRKFECDGQRPRGVLDPNALKQSNPNEDPRLEAAKQRSRGTQDAAKQALKALEERRRIEQREKERAGLMRRVDTGGSGRAVPLNSSSGQVKPAPRLRQCHKWQGVQRTDEDAQKVVSRALGGCAVDTTATARRVEDSEVSALRRKGDCAAKADDVFDDLAERIERAERSRSRSRSRSSAGDGEPAGDVVVDYF